MADPRCAPAALVRVDQACRTDESGAMLMPSERQVAIVTGPASGIGRAMTLGLLEEGICVLGVDREPVWKLVATMPIEPD